MKTSALLIIIMSLCSGALAEKMDLSTHSKLIEKLSGILETLPEDDSSANALSVRLADLYAERARLYDEASDKKGSEDRAQALKYYKDVFPKLDKDQKSKVLSQMGHLYELTDQTAKSTELYKNVVKKSSSYSSVVRGQAYVGLAEMEFSKVQYKKAEKDFKKALAIPETKRRGYVNARLAWCYFHEGKISLALQTMKSLLNNPELLPRTTENKSDVSFREEVARDYATFLSKTNVTASDIKSLSALTPESTRKDNLTYLATELDRLGKKSSALEVWKIVGIENKSPGSGDIEDHYKLAQLNYDVNKKDVTVAELELALDSWKSKGCETEENCPVVKSKIRKLITDWAASEERAPSPLLIKAYAVYLSVFPDLEMSYWAAGAARGASQWIQSIGFYRSAAVQAQSELKKKDGNPKAVTIFEGSCLGEIEVAELSKVSGLRSEAYNHYLAVNPNGSKASEIRYQIAHLSYELGQFGFAAIQFHNLAIATSEKQLAIREKAADLSIESLIASKDESNIPTWSVEYSKLFSTRKVEFLALSRKSILNREAQVINNSQASTQNLEKSLEDLNHVNLDKATNSEKIAYYKNRLIVSERLQNLTEVDHAATGLLSVKKGLSEEDREFALSRKAWVAELRLNFTEAFKITSHLKMKSLSKEERLLKLAMLATLAGKKADAYYYDYLAVTKNKEKAQVIVANLIRASKKPYPLFIKYQNILRRNAELFSELALDVFSKTQDYEFARRFIKHSSVRQTAGGKVLYRFVFMKDFNAFTKNNSTIRLNGKTARSLKLTLGSRLAIINQIERKAQTAINSGDWTLELITLTAVQKEYTSLAKQITGLPIPSGLKKAERSQYIVLLAKQAAPYQMKASGISVKITELWKNTDFKTLVSEVGNTKGSVRKLVTQELKLIIHLAPADKHSEAMAEVSSYLLASSHSPSPSHISEARESVRANPFSENKIERLKSLEAEAGQDTVVAYLDSRLDQIHGGRK